MRVKLSEFWRRMELAFGEAYAHSLAKDYVFSELDGQTVTEALKAHMAPLDVWRAVGRTFEVPASIR